MAYKISDECIMCGTCEGECPVGAIAEASTRSTQTHASSAEAAQLHVQ